MGWGGRGYWEYSWEVKSNKAERNKEFIIIGHISSFHFSLMKLYYKVSTHARTHMHARTHKHMHTHSLLPTWRPLYPRLCSVPSPSDVFRRCSDSVTSPCSISFGARMPGKSMMTTTFVSAIADFWATILREILVVSAMESSCKISLSWNWQ